MSDDPNDRATRLAGRWGSDADEPDAVDSEATEESVGSDEASGAGESAGGGTGEGTAEGAIAEEGGLKGETAEEEQERELTTREMQSQMLYLPPEFHKEIDLTFEELNLRFRRERDRKLEKNKDFYTGLLRLGLDGLGDVRDRELDEIEGLLDL